MPSTVSSAAASAVLSDAFLAAAVYALVQWIIKPLIVTYWLPQGNPYQDNATRAAGFIVAYALTFINTAVQQPVTWALAWALLPTAAGIYASSALVYHISTPGTPAPAPVVIPAPAPQPATPSLGAAGEVESIVAALTALAAAIASGHAVAAPPATAIVTPAPAAPPANSAPAVPVAPAPPWEALPTGEDVDPLTRALGATLAPALGTAGGPAA